MDMEMAMAMDMQMEMAVEMDMAMQMEMDMAMEIEMEIEMEMEMEMAMDKIKWTDFEEFLSEKFAESIRYTENDVFDDDFPDAYSDWSEELCYEDYIRFGNIYGRIKQGESNVKS